MKPALFIVWVCTIMLTGLLLGKLLAGYKPSPEDIARRRDEWQTSTESKISYIRDRRTGFCFAVHSEPQYITWGGQVPCTPEVEKLLVDAL